MTGRSFHYPGVPKEYPIVNKSTDIHWYPLRVTYSRELLLKGILDAEKIENFIPMHYEYIRKGERKVRKLVPAFEIIKVGKMWVKRKTQKNTAI